MASLSGEIDWSVALSIVIWGIAGLWVFDKIASQMVVKKALPALNWFHRLGLGFVFLLSLSIFPSPGTLLTSYRVLQIFIIVLFSAFWISEFGVDSTLKHLTIGFVLLAVAIGLAALFSPNLVYAGSRLRGDFIANTGAVGTFAFALLVGYPESMRGKSYLPALSLALVLLVFSRTRSAYAAAAVVVILGLIRFPKSNRIQRVNILLTAAIPVILLFQWFPLIESWIIRDESSISTLSDRIPLWEYALDYIWEHSPWIGVGFYANRSITRAYNPGLGTSHSAFIEILVGGGVLSFSVFALLSIAVIIMAAKLFLQRGKSPEVFTAVCLFLGSIAFGIVSEEMIIASPTSFTFWMSTSMLVWLNRGESNINHVDSSHERYESPPDSQLLPAARR